MKTSEMLKEQMKKLQAQHDKDLAALYKKTKNPTKEQYRPILDMSRKIDDLDFQIVKERRREIEVGDGCTLVYFTDKEAYTVIRKTKTMIVMQRDRAIKDPNFKPEWIPGGFSAHCLNNEDQKYTYERDEDGSVIKAYWHESEGCYMHQGCKVINGRHEFYDYNF